MGCGSSSAGQVMNDNEDGNGRNDAKNKKKKENIKIEITEDPEQQGEKFHQEENNEDSFDEF